MDGSTRLRVAVIGVGLMGRNHARIYSELDSVDLVAVADPDTKATTSVATRHEAHQYADFKAMLAAESLDMVSVTVPTALHYEVAEEVVGSGVNLLIEKPIASTVADAERIVQLAHEKGVLLGVGHVERFNPIVTEMKRRLDLGELGRVLQTTIRRFGPFPERVKDMGVFLDLATHDIDVMYYLTSSEVERISSESAQVLHGQHEDLAVSLLRFENGVIGVLIENWLSPTKVRDIMVNGERGMYHADFLTQDFYFYENNYTAVEWDSLQVFRGMSEGDMVRYRIDRDEPLRLELEAFARAVETGEPFLVTGEDGLRAMRLALLLGDNASQLRSAVDTP